jgi:hypothetical protein
MERFRGRKARSRDWTFKAMISGMREHMKLTFGTYVTQIEQRRRYLAALVIRHAITVFCRQGTRPLPWALGNNMDSFLRSLVSLFFDETEIMRAQNPQNPQVILEEIHFFFNRWLDLVLTLLVLATILVTMTEIFSRI